MAARMRHVSIRNADYTYRVTYPYGQIAGKMCVVYAKRYQLVQRNLIACVLAFRHFGASKYTRCWVLCKGMLSTDFVSFHNPNIA